MKSLFLCLLTGALIYTANAQTFTLTISETGETFDSITADLNGAPVAITLTGAVDGWTIELPDTFSLLPIGSVLLGEPGDPSLVNEVLVGTTPHFLTWNSDITVAGVSGLPTELTIANAGTFVTAPLSLVLRDVAPHTTTPTPDAGATATLMLGAGSLLLAGRRLVK